MQKIIYLLASLFIFFKPSYSQETVESQIAKNKIRNKEIINFIKTNSHPKDLESQLKEAYKFLTNPAFCTESIYKNFETINQKKISSKQDADMYLTQMGQHTAALSGCSGVEEKKLIQWILDHNLTAKQKEAFAMILKDYIKARFKKSIFSIEIILISAILSNEKIKLIWQPTMNIHASLKIFKQRYVKIIDPKMPANFPKTDFESMKKWAEKTQSSTIQRIQLSKEIQSSALSSI